MEIEGKKRKRATNYTDREIDVLVNAVVSNRELLFNKFNDQITNQRKQRKWESIAAEVNSVNTGPARAVGELRIKWRKLASECKMKAARRISETRRTGGGPPPPELTSTEEKVVSCLAEELIDGIPDGLDSSENRPPLTELSFESADQSYGATVTVQHPISGPSTSAQDSLGQRPLPAPPLPKKQRLQMDNHFLDLERERLAIDRERLAVEKDRLVVETRIANLLQSLVRGSGSFLNDLLCE